LTLCVNQFGYRIAALTLTRKLLTRLAFISEGQLAGFYQLVKYVSTKPLNLQAKLVGHPGDIVGACLGKGPAGGCRGDYTERPENTGETPQYQHKKKAPAQDQPHAEKMSPNLLRLWPQNFSDGRPTHTRHS
jgi:hypothetical protein